MKLKPQVFERNFRKFGVPKLGLFAYRINHKIARCFSRKQDSIPIAIDAFSAKWNTEFYYIFSPCSLLWKAIAKMHGTIQNVKWTCPDGQHNIGTQIFWIKRTIIIQPSPGDLIQPQDPEKLHLLHWEIHT